MTRSVSTRRDLIAAGVPERTITNRCRPGGPWQRLLPGVVLLQRGVPTFPQRCAAALAYAGAESMVTGLAACRLHGLRRVPADDSVHVLVPAGRQPSSHDFVVVERTRRMPVPLDRNGLRVTPVARAAIDGARRLGSIDEIRSLLAEVVQSGRATSGQLNAELSGSGNRGSALPRQVLAEISVGVRSTAEAWARRLAQRSGLPEMWWNPEVRLADGSLLAIPDGWIDEVALAWEIDSYEFHLSPADYARTLQRHAAMTAAGVIVLHTLPGRLRNSPRTVLAELRGAYQLAASRPRPPLLAQRAST